MFIYKDTILNQKGFLFLYDITNKHLKNSSNKFQDFCIQRFNSNSIFISNNLKLENMVRGNKHYDHLLLNRLLKYFLEIDEIEGDNNFFY